MRKEKQNMENMKELNMEELEQVSGGVKSNTGIDGVDAALRKEARKSSKQIGHIPNGSDVTILSSSVYDSESRRHFVQVDYNGKVGWIAASFVGLPR